jgi:hypothetical protein
MRRGLSVVGCAAAAVAAALALAGCMTVHVNMPGSPAAAATSAKSAQVTTAQATLSEDEQLSKSVTEAARAKAAAMTKRWVQLVKATDTVLAPGPGGHRYAAVTIHIPGMDPALFVYRRDGSVWTLLGYGASKQAKASRPLYGVSAQTWKALLG